MTLRRASAGADVDSGDRPWDVVVVGAGAAGLMTAIVARRKNPAGTVLVLDGAPRAGAKILVSGGGRCNVTNREVTDRDFWGGSRPTIRRVLRRFSASDAQAFFEDLGVPLREEAGGKIFPASHRARDIRDALVAEIARVGVAMRLGCRVQDIDHDGRQFRLITSSGPIWCQRVVLATGGLSLPRTGSDGAGLDFARHLGHSTTPTTPALVGLRLAPSHADVHTRLSGIALDVELAVWVAGRVQIRLRGPMLWTHAGISGPAVLDASRHILQARAAGLHVALTANIFPGRHFSDLDEEWRQTALETPRASIVSMLTRHLPASAADAFVAHLGIESQRDLAHFGRDDRRRLARMMTEWPLPVVESQGYQRAEVTAGGVRLEEIDPASMESRRCPGLFLVGEILDVDGRLGGFNFQWAWSTGYVAGQALGSTPPAARTSDS